MNYPTLRRRNEPPAAAAAHDPIPASPPIIATGAMNWKQFADDFQCEINNGSSCRYNWIFFSLPHTEYSSVLTRRHLPCRNDDDDDVEERHAEECPTIRFPIAPGSPVQSAKTEQERRYKWSSLSLIVRIRRRPASSNREDMMSIGTRLKWVLEIAISCYGKTRTSAVDALTAARFIIFSYYYFYLCPSSAAHLWTGWMDG